jgi:phosphatidylserine decarboxylase
MSEDLDSKSTPWMNIGLDWEGVAAALGALLVALLLGVIWSPLFWIGFAGVVIALMAARWSHRTPPDLANGIVAPCDGVVVSVGRAEAPSELRLTESGVTRIRIASAPSATNKVYTPIAGSVESMIFEAGENTVPLAARADDDGLARAFLTFESRGQQVGVRLASGGFGPRIDLATEAGDIVRLGRPFGTRRLGGWCDVYVPNGVGMLIWPGQTLIGGETVMGRLKSQGDTDLFDGMAEEDADGEPALQVEDNAQVEVEEEDDDEYPSPEEMETPDDPAVILARLREASRRHDD